MGPIAQWIPVGAPPRGEALNAATQTESYCLIDESGLSRVAIREVLKKSIYRHSREGGSPGAAEVLAYSPSGQHKRCSAIKLLSRLRGNAAISEFPKVGFSPPTVVGVG